MNRGTITPEFTIGFGNNIFQYCFSRLLSEKNGLHLVTQGISELEIEKTMPSIVDASLPTYRITDANAMDAMNSRLPPGHYKVFGYFEDYRFYENHIDTIRNWFPKTTKTNKNELILHLRLQNRLVQISHHKNHVHADCYKRTIEKFNCDKLHIVTDAKKWDFYNHDDIQEIRDEIANGPNPASNSPWVSMDRSLEYINHLISDLQEFNPIIHCNQADTIIGSGGLRGDFMKDFNLIRSFDNVMLFNSTFSWWAALLGGASKVGTFGPWKPNKGSNSKNLGKATFPGWFSWGSVDDLYWRDL